MIWPIYVFYILCVGFVLIYKWFELQILKLFNPLLRRFGTKLLEKQGVALQCPGDPELTQADNERVLSKCSKYDNIIHVKIHNAGVFARVANSNVLGFAEAYLDKQWDLCDGYENLTEFGKRLIENNVLNLYYNSWNTFVEWLELFAFNLQTRKRAFQVGVVHYDLGE